MCEWSSDVCLSDLGVVLLQVDVGERVRDARRVEGRFHAEAVLAQQAAPIVEERARAVVGQTGAEVGQVRAGQHLLDMRAPEQTGSAGVHVNRKSDVQGQCVYDALAFGGGRN